MLLYTQWLHFLVFKVAEHNSQESAGYVSALPAIIIQK